MIRRAVEFYGFWVLLVAASWGLAVGSGYVVWSVL